MALFHNSTLELVVSTRIRPESMKGGTGTPHLGSGTQLGQGLIAVKVPFGKQVNLML